MEKKFRTHVVRMKYRWQCESAVVVCLKLLNVCCADQEWVSSVQPDAREAGALLLAQVPSVGPGLRWSSLGLDLVNPKPRSSLADPCEEVMMVQILACTG